MKKALENFKTHLKLHGLRMTQEREELFKLVMDSKSHFSPEDILQKVKDRRLNISRATIYRVLPVLQKAELIQQSLLQEGQSHFEVSWNKEHHDHLICSQCHKVVEFADDRIEQLQDQIAKKFGFKLQHHVMELVGICQSCNKTSANKN